MLHWTLRLSLLCALLALAGGAGGAGAGLQGDAALHVDRPGQHERYVPGEILVRFRADVPVATRGAMAHARGARLAPAAGAPGLAIVQLPEGSSVPEEAAVFASDPRVLYAEPNHIYRLSAPVIPNDPRFDELWGLDQASDKDIDAPEAWELHKGNKRVVVAVIDSGVAYGHPDLAPNIWINTKDPAGGGDQDKNGFANDTRGWDFVQKDNTPYDVNGHGTHVAGTIGAVGNNNVGVTGVNWNVSLMNLRAADAYGSLTAANIVAAINYACKNGAHVVNGSFGSSAKNTSITNAIKSTACQKTLFVFAAGNEGWNLEGNTGVNDRSYPCELHLAPPAGENAANVLCVAATDENDARPSFSNYGTSSVHIAAPGHPILSTWPTWTSVYFDDFEEAGTWGNRLFAPGSVQWNRTQAESTSGAYSLTDSPGGNYVANTVTSIRNMTSAKTTGRVGCLLDYELLLDSELGYDGLIVSAGTVTNPQTDVSAWSGSTEGDFMSVTDDLSFLDGKANVYIRLWFVSDNVNQFDGAYVDDVRVKCLAHGGSAYDSISGTSMATPHVAGVAALLLDRNPGLTVAQLKTAILDGADTVGGLPVVGGNRLNAHGALLEVADAPPNTLITSGPAAFTNKLSATIAFTATETATFECAHAEDPFEPCTSPVTLPGLGAGAHTFQVRATDSAEQVDLTPAVRNWTIDLVKPNTTLTGGPKGRVKAKKATFKFKANEVGSKFQCKIDKKPFQACKSGKTYKNLKKGKHTFRVRAVDKAGNVDATPAKRTWTIR